MIFMKVNQGGAQAYGLWIIAYGRRKPIDHML